MKKMLVILLAALMTFGCCAALAEDAVLPQTLVMGFDSAYPPMTYTDADGETYIGFDIELAVEVASRLGITLEYQPINWDSKEDELGITKSIDCIWSGLTMTEALKARFAFSMPYMANEQVLVVKADSGIATIGDVAGKKLGTQAGSSSVTVLDANPDLTDSLAGGEPYLFDDFQLALLDLANGNLDVVLVDSVVVNFWITQQDDPSAYTVLPDVLEGEEYGIAFRNDDAALAEAVNQQLIAIYEDGTLDAIRAKYFANDVTVIADYADAYRK